MSDQQIPKIDQQQIRLIQSLMALKGISAEEMVRDICKQRGIDVDAFMKQIEEGLAKH